MPFPNKLFSGQCEHNNRRSPTPRRSLKSQYSILVHPPYVTKLLSIKQVGHQENIEGY
ncbi:hypothetical protein ACU8KH_05710 [Lachancea thermotolerans]